MKKRKERKQREMEDDGSCSDGEGIVLMDLDDGGEASDDEITEEDFSVVKSRSSKGRAVHYIVKSRCLR